MPNTIQNVHFLEHFHTGIYFGEQVRELREKCGMSQQELADRINKLCKSKLKRNTISNYERGKSFPDRQKLMAIVHILDTTSDALLGLGSKDKYKSPSKMIYRNVIEESKTEDLTTVFSLADQGITPLLREVKYILAKEHDCYAQNYNDTSYIQSLPSIKVPYKRVEPQLRAFQISVSVQSDSYLCKVGPGDIVIAEKVNSPVQNELAFHLVTWKNYGLKILRYFELVQLFEAKDIGEVWNPIAILKYYPLAN